MDNLLLFEVLTASFAAKIKALKQTLNDEQLKIYNQSLAESTEKILKLHESLSPELRKIVDEQFS